MTKKIKWRLAERPTPSEISLLVEKELLTKDEAREILFSQETEEDRDKKSLESEIKFLRELVEKLSKNNNSTIVETIRYIEKPYYPQPWFQPYATWCSNTSGAIGGGIGSSSLLVGGANDGTLSYSYTNGIESTNTSFSQIN